MRPFENRELDPEIAAELSALDAALAEEPVDPEHAELAELAVLVRAERPEIDPASAAELDGRVARRFAAAAPGRSAAAGRPRRRIRMWVVSGAAGALACGLAAVALVGSSSGPVERLTTTSTAPSPVGSRSSGAPSSPATSTGAPAARGRSAGAAPLTSTSSSPGTAPGVGSSSSLPQAAADARKVVRSAQLALTTSPARVDDVAGEVFDVVRVEGGFVGQSTVTATGGSDGYAQFQLSVPSANLANAMGRLSRLRGASVASRTDTTQDVNDQYGALNRRLADARALRTALLKQLAGASDPQQVSSLKGQIADAGKAISRAQSDLNSLNHQINYTQISLTVSTDSQQVATGGFTIGRAAHDAGRVLTVAAGVALIALAVLVPLALVASLLWWGVAILRRRRREHALDLA